MYKDFEGWNKEKQKIDLSNRVVYPKPREIWYIKIGINIGNEIYGKAGFFRPVLVISRIGNIYFCLALSTKSNNPKYVIPIVYPGSNKESYIKINQGRVYDSLRFFKKLGRITRYNFQIIKNLLRETYFPRDS